MGRERQHGRGAAREGRSSIGRAGIDGAEPHACTRIAEFEPGVQEQCQVIDRCEAKELCHKDHEHSSC